MKIMKILDSHERINKKKMKFKISGDIYSGVAIVKFFKFPKVNEDT